MQADSSADHIVKAAALESESGPAKASHATGGKCCGLMCVTAIAAPLLAVVQPPMPKAIRMADSYRKLADDAPAVHYRPPIS